MNTYHFGIPGIFIWIMHILIGGFLFYIGQRISQSEMIEPATGGWIISLGALSLAYHAHLWYDSS